MLRTLTLDRRRVGHQPRISRAERVFARNLTRLAVHVGQMVSGVNPVANPAAVPAVADMLRRYADALMPWAEATVASMVADVNARDLAMWRNAGQQMSEAVRREILGAPTGEAMRDLMASQVELIRSIPLEAAQRVHDLTIAGLEDGPRAARIAEEIMRTGEVAKSRAMLIARTEVARTASTLTQARAEHVGSEGYIWRTSKDGDVRKSHKQMAGKFVRWDEPPTLDNLKGHAGCLPNCRCYPEPVLPD